MRGHRSIECRMTPSPHWPSPPRAEGGTSARHAFRYQPECDGLACAKEWQRFPGGHGRAPPFADMLSCRRTIGGRESRPTINEERPSMIVLQRILLAGFAAIAGAGFAQIPAPSRQRAGDHRQGRHGALDLHGLDPVGGREGLLQGVRHQGGEREPRHRRQLDRAAGAEPVAARRGRHLGRLLQRAGEEPAGHHGARPGVEPARP